jgi:hypothetical protein
MTIDDPGRGIAIDIPVTDRNIVEMRARVLRRPLF